MSLGRISPIRDIVHDYISPTIFEREVIDSLYFQRLHFVLQNSTVYSTYPCNKNSRFAHSLGVSHIAGNMLIQALKNASTPTLEIFLKDALGLIEECDADTKSLVETWRDQLGNAARFLHNPAINKEGSVNYPRGSKEPMEPVVSNAHVCSDTGFCDEASGVPVEFVVNTMWVATRLCGLCHDIGHMPSSHSFEHALSELKKPNSIFNLYKAEGGRHEGALENIQKLTSHDENDVFSEHVSNAQKEHILRLIFGDNRKAFEDYIASDMAIHEVRGYRILDKIIRESKDFEKTNKSYRDLVFKLAQLIFLCCSPKVINPLGCGALALPAIRSIIAGELDADRLDYTVRDGIESGVEIGSIDLARIVNSQILVSELDVRATDTRRSTPSFKGLEICSLSSSTSAIAAFFHHRYLSYENVIYHKAVQRAAGLLEQIVQHLIYICRVLPETDVARICVDRELIKYTNSVPEIAEILPLDSYEKFDDGWLRGIIFECRSVLNAAVKDGKKLSLSQKTLLGMIEAWATRDTAKCVALIKSRADAEQVLDDAGFNRNLFTITSDEEKAALAEFVFDWNNEHLGNEYRLLVQKIVPKIYEPELEKNPKKPEHLIFDRSNRHIYYLSGISAYTDSLREVYRNSPNFLMFLFNPQKFDTFPQDIRRTLLANLIDKLASKDPRPKVKRR